MVLTEEFRSIMYSQVLFAEGSEIEVYLHPWEPQFGNDFGVTSMWIEPSEWNVDLEENWVSNNGSIEFWPVSSEEELTHASFFWTSGLPGTVGIWITWVHLLEPVVVEPDVPIVIEAGELRFRVLSAAEFLAELEESGLL